MLDLGPLDFIHSEGLRRGMLGKAPLENSPLVCYFRVGPPPATQWVFWSSFFFFSLLWLFPPAPYNFHITVHITSFDDALASSWVHYSCRASLLTATSCRNAVFSSASSTPTISAKERVWNSNSRKIEFEFDLFHGLTLNGPAWVFCF